MPDIFIYMFKVSAGLAIIFLPYYFLFRNDPNLIIKRFYLLAGLAAAWIFPFITFRKISLAVDLTPTVFIDLDAPVTTPVLLENMGSTSGLTINWLQVLIIIYLAGLTFMFLKSLFIILKWNFTWLRNHDDKGVAYTKNDQVFTLFTRIFVPGSLKEEQDLDNILLHEKAHIQQLHFIDLMLMEFTLLLTWFNPFSWLISRMIKENHEHLADRQVLSAGVNPARYKAQLMNHTLGVNVFRLGNQFNHSLTLKRFKMMKKPEKSPLGILKIALLIPMILITLGLTTGMTPQQKTVKGKVVFADTGKPATGASIVIRNSTVGCVVDTDGTFMLNVDGNPELVVSFVGYSSLIVKASEIGKKPLQLKVKTYTMDLESVAMVVKKESSGAISIKQKDGSDAQPVFLLDGNVVEEIDNLNPDLIESISVIKDQDDPLVQKHNAKNGLIVITSKEGKGARNYESGMKEDDKKQSEPFTFKRMEGTDADPVYIVDGQQVDGIDNINSDHIENVDVIKDQDHPLVKQYNATGGLIIITSKKGTKLLSPKEVKDNVSESFEKDGETFYIVEDMPQFPGGKPALKTYIYSNLEYPEKAKSQKIEGDVVVQFVIDTDGKPKNIKVIRSSYQGFDDPAMKVIREMPDWNPGKQRGKAVNVQFAVTIKFPAPKE